MSLNLGTLATNAAFSMRSSDHWRDIRAGLKVVAERSMNDALAADNRVDATAYARALRDVYVALEAATTGERQNVTAKPGMEKTSAPR